MSTRGGSHRVLAPPRTMEHSMDVPAVLDELLRSTARTGRLR